MALASIPNDPMSPIERRSVVLLAAIYGLRIAGLFLLLPVLAVYAQQLPGATPLLIGLAVGVYGLTQAALQIPFGWLSDRWGRKPVITLGLLVFAAGSVVAALAHSIVGVILGRAIQGAGAIPAAVMALASDLTREQQRLKAMAVIGATIGASFILSMALGPVLNTILGVPGIFWLIACLAAGAVGVLWLGVPTPTRARRATVDKFWTAFKNPQLLGLDFGVFVLHLVLTALFVVLPIALVQHAALPVGQHWKLYIPVLLASLAGTVPLILLTQNRQKVFRILALAVAVLIAAQGVLFFGYSRSLMVVAAGLWLFFAAFNLLEALLPALISRLAPMHAKGAVIGVYSTAQFLGAFTGGVLGGWVQGVFGTGGVFAVCMAALALWLLVNLRLPEPKLLVTEVLALTAPKAAPQDLARKLMALPGVAEAVVLPEDGLAYLKVDPLIFRKEAAEELGLSG